MRRTPLVAVGVMLLLGLLAGPVAAQTYTGDPYTYTGAAVPQLGSIDPGGAGATSGVRIVNPGGVGATPRAQIVDPGAAGGTPGVRTDAGASGQGRASGGVLAFTGADFIQLLLIALAAVAVGIVMARRSRSDRPA